MVFGQEGRAFCTPNNKARIAMIQARFFMDRSAL
jgi:hypothetical protein